MATKLTTNQLRDLRHDLTSLGRITYDHLADELLDHYATLTEEKMEAGLSFYEASTAAFVEMGNGLGIQTIQDTYERSTKKQVRARHAAIMKSYFCWPTVVTTLLVGTLLGNIYVNLPADSAKIMAYILAFSPSAVILAAWIPYYRKKDSSQKLVWRYISDNGSWPLNLFNSFVILNGSDTLLVPFTTHLSVAALLAGGMLFQAISLAQLTRETFYFKPSFQL